LYRKNVKELGKKEGASLLTESGSGEKMKGVLGNLRVRKNQARARRDRFRIQGKSREEGG